MSPSPGPRLLLCFNGAYVEQARLLARRLQEASLRISFDQWSGGGGTPSRRSLQQGLDGIGAVLVLLTPSEATPTWISPEWLTSVHQPAMAAGLPVLPIRGAQCEIPQPFKDLDFADIHNRDYDLELGRLLDSLAEHLGVEQLSSTAKIPSSKQRSARQNPPSRYDIPVLLECAAELADLFNNDPRQPFQSEQVPFLRGGLHFELGVALPGIQVRHEENLTGDEVRILIYGVPEAWFRARRLQVLVDDKAASLRKRGFDARSAINPASGMPAAWIPRSQVQAAEAEGLTSWEVRDYLTLTLGAVLRRKAPSFVGLEETRGMLRQLAAAFPRLISETVPKAENRVRPAFLYLGCCLAQ